jgi:ribose 5-phosphate isomerase B
MIYLASDHGGFKLKEAIKQWLEEENIAFVDGGTNSEEVEYFPTFARAAVKSILGGKAQSAILICGTGTGMAMQANRFKGVRAVATDRVDFARLAREHNDANVLCLAGRFIELNKAKEIIKTFRETPFLEGTPRYVKRRAMLDE